MTVFISYAHDGNTLAAWLVEQLSAAGWDVRWDGNLAEHNPSSIQEWMEEQVQSSIVVCVVTREYAERFGRGSDSPKRKGVLYESRAIEQRLHDHTPSGACPVIPVTPESYPVDELPSALRRLLVTKISQGSHSGIDELLTRIRALSHTFKVINRSPESVMETTSGSESEPQTIVANTELRDLLSRLESVQPGTATAISVVNEWLELVEKSTMTPPLFATGFPDAEKIAKTAGDLDLMRRISNACLTVVRRSEPRLRSDLEIEARILVCGEGWYLQRSHELQAALDSTKLGVQLASKIGDRRTEAFGKKCLGRLERLVAESTRDYAEAQTYLEQSVCLLGNAREMFFGIDGTDSDEAGDCLSLEARTWLTHYRLNASPEHLSQAAGRITQAEEIIPPGNSKDYLDLVVLKAELALEGRHFTQASGLLQQVIDRLHDNADASRSEILARALCAHALVMERWRPRAGAAQALRNLKEAEKIYSQLGQEHSATECIWRQVVIEPARITSLQISRQELEELAKQEPDPQLRLEAVRKFDAQEKARIGTSIGRRLTKVKWDTILHQTRMGDRRRDA